MNTLEISILIGIVVVIPLLGYLAACAGAQRWITLKEWFGEY